MREAFITPLFELRKGRRVRRKTPLVEGVGIEVELESPMNTNALYERLMSRIAAKEEPPKFWRVKPDHSLRNGAEVVSDGPLPIPKMSAAAAEFEALTKGLPFRDDSIRTSVHYHVNVERLTVMQILAAITGYWLIETPLVATQPPHRQGNLFCLRVSDADYLLEDLCIELREMSHPLVDGRNLSDNVKYGAINLGTPAKFGSLEFRFNEGTRDTSEIARWAHFFKGMVARLADLGTPRDVLDKYDAVGPEAFMRLLTPRWLQQRIEQSCPDYIQAIQSNYSYVYILVSCAHQAAEQQEVRRTGPYLFEASEDMVAAEFEVIHFSPDEAELPQPRFVNPRSSYTPVPPPVMHTTIPVPEMWTDDELEVFIED